MTSERTRLYNALEKILGSEPTRLLMERIDPIDQFATKADLNEMGRSIRGDFETRFEAVDRRLETIDLRFVAIDERFDNIDRQFENIAKQFEKVDDRLCQFHETLRGYSRTFVTTQAASIVGAVGLAVTLIKLF